jgi:hypothetical protein
MVPNKYFEHYIEDMSYNEEKEDVPGRGLEPPHLAVHAPKACASANSAIPAIQYKRE